MSLNATLGLSPVWRNLPLPGVCTHNSSDGVNSYAYTIIRSPKRQHRWRSHKMFNVTHLLTLLFEPISIWIERKKKDLLSRRRPPMFMSGIRIWWHLIEMERAIRCLAKANEKKTENYYYYFSITFYCMSLFSIDDAMHRNQTFSYNLCAVASSQAQFSRRYIYDGPQTANPNVYFCVPKKLCTRGWCTYALVVVVVAVVILSPP